MPIGLWTTGGRVAQLCGRVRAATEDGPRTNSRTQGALCVLPYAATQLPTDQDQAVVAASLELVVEIAARTALDGVMSQLQIARHALGVSMLVPVLQGAQAILLVTKVVVANGAMLVVIAATMVQAGVTSPALIAQRVQAGSTAVRHRQDAGEMPQLELPHSPPCQKSSLMWHRCF